MKLLLLTLISFVVTFSVMVDAVSEETKNSVQQQVFSCISIIADELKGELDKVLSASSTFDLRVAGDLVLLKGKRSFVWDKERESVHQDDSRARDLILLTPLQLYDSSRILFVVLKGIKKPP